MNKIIYTAAVAAILAIGAPAWSQAVATQSTSHSKVTTTNGKVTSATKSNKSAACRNEKGVFIKCVSTVKTSAANTITKGSDGKCRFAAGPRKGQFTKCP